MDITDVIWKFLTQNSWTMVIVASLFGLAYWVIKHPRSAELHAKNIRNFATWLREQLGKLFKRLTLKIKATHDQMTINKVIGDINGQTHSQIPKARVHYESTRSGYHSYSTRPDGVVKVFAEDTGDDNQNLLNATSAYLKTAIIANLRPLVQNIAAAIDLIVIMRILKKRNKKGLCGTFWGKNFVQEMSNAGVHTYVDNFLSEEKKGIFTGITLSEMEHANDIPFYQASAAGETEMLKAELIDFVAFTMSVSNRGSGERTPLEFNRKYIKVGVLLVGGVLTKLYGAQPYLTRLAKSIQQGVERVYVVAVGDDNVELTKEIAMHNIERAVIVKNLKVFHPEMFDFRPTIMSLLLVARPV